MSLASHANATALAVPGVVSLSDRLSPLALDSFGWIASHGAAACTVLAKLTFALNETGFAMASDQDALTRRPQRQATTVPGHLYRSSDYAPFKELSDVYVVGTKELPGPATRSARTRARMLVSVPQPATQPHGSPRALQLRKQGRASLFAPLAANTKEGAGSSRSNGFNSGSEAWKGRPLPAQFDPSCFNDAPADQRIAHLSANPLIHLENFHPERLVLTGRLPNLTPTAAVLKDGRLLRIGLSPDTLWIDVERARCTLTWRGSFATGCAREATTGPIYVALGDANQVVSDQELHRLIQEKRVQRSGVHTRMQRSKASVIPPARPACATLVVAPKAPSSDKPSLASNVLPFREKATPPQRALPQTHMVPPAPMAVPKRTTPQPSPWTGASQQFVPRIPKTANGKSTPPPMMTGNGKPRRSLPALIDGPLELLCWDEDQATAVASSKTLPKMKSGVRSTNEILRAVFDGSQGGSPRLSANDIISMLDSAVSLDTAASQTQLHQSLEKGHQLPLNVMHGHLVFQYDAFAALEALLAAMGPVVDNPTATNAEGDNEALSPLQTAAKQAHTLLKSTYRCPEWATKLGQQIQKELANAKHDLETIRGRMNRMLVRKRAYQYSEFNGRRWFRATLRNGSEQAPLYVPSEFAATMPLFPSLSAKVLVQVSPPRAQSDKGALVLTAIAIARCIATKESHNG